MRRFGLSCCSPDVEERACTCTPRGEELSVAHEGSRVPALPKQPLLASHARERGRVDSQLRIQTRGGQASLRSGGSRNHALACCKRRQGKGRNAHHFGDGFVPELRLERLTAARLLPARIRLTKSTPTKVATTEVDKLTKFKSASTLKQKHKRWSHWKN